MREHPLDIAIFVLTPPFVTNVVTSLGVLRLLRLLPLLRLGRLVRTLISAEGPRCAALLALLTAFASGLAFASIENKSIGVGIYWAMATMTTVGYGDIVPTTAGGRAVAVGRDARGQRPLRVGHRPHLRTVRKRRSEPLRNSSGIRENATRRTEVPRPRPASKSRRLT